MEQKHQYLTSSGKIVQNMYQSLKGNSSNIPKVRLVKVLMKENPPNERTVAKLLKCSDTVNKSINHDMN